MNLIRVRIISDILMTQDHVDIGKCDFYLHCFAERKKERWLQYPLKTRSAKHALGAVLTARLCGGKVPPSPV